MFGRRIQGVIESKKIDMSKSDKDSWEMAREVLEDGCLSATFAPGGTMAGETHVEQHEASPRHRNVRGAKGEQ